VNDFDSGDQNFHSHELEFERLEGWGALSLLRWDPSHAPGSDLDSI
jgi:hypothetical protein